MANGELTQDVANIESRLDQQIRKLNTQQTIILVVGIVLVVILLIYFAWLNTQVKKMTEPEDVSNIVTEEIVKRIPEVRMELEIYAVEALPEMANKTIDEIINQIPRVRQMAHERLNEKADAILAQVTQEILLEVDEALEQHGDEVRVLAQELETDEGREAFEQYVYEMMDEILSDYETGLQVVQYGEALQEYRGLLHYLAAEEPLQLDPKEQNVQALIMNIREHLRRAEEEGTIPPL